MVVFVDTLLSGKRKTTEIQQFNWYSAVGI